VTDTGSGLPLDVSLVEPNAVAERHLRPEQAEAADVLNDGALAPARVFLLVGRLQQVHVQRHTA